jgi:hypothetical protein
MALLKLVYWWPLIRPEDKPNSRRVLGKIRFFMKTINFELFVNQEGLSHLGQSVIVCCRYLLYFPWLWVVINYFRLQALENLARLGESEQSQPDNGGTKVQGAMGEEHNVGKGVRKDNGGCLY